MGTRAPSTKARPAAVVRTPQQSAERRARARVMGLGDLRRSGDRPDREAGHRVRRIRTSACRRSAPPSRGAQMPADAEGKVRREPNPGRNAPRDRDYISTDREGIEWKTEPTTSPPQRLRG